MGESQEECNLLLFFVCFVFFVDELRLLVLSVAGAQWKTRQHMVFV